MIKSIRNLFTASRTTKGQSSTYISWFPDIKMGAYIKEEGVNIIIGIKIHTNYDSSFTYRNSFTSEGDRGGFFLLADENEYNKVNKVNSSAHFKVSIFRSKFYEFKQVSRRDTGLTGDGAPRAEIIYEAEIPKTLENEQFLLVTGRYDSDYNGYRLMSPAINHTINSANKRWTTLELGNIDDKPFKLIEILNRKPTISGKDEDLGNISDEISKTYTVFDEDDDKLSIIERLNNTVIGVHNDVKSGTSKILIISKEDIYKLPIGKRNTISIEVSDGQEKTYRNWTFTRTNTAPIIQVLTDTELGNIIKPFETKIKVSDPEHDKVNVTYTVNKIVLDENESYIRIPVHTTEMEDIKLNSELKYTIGREVWDKLLIGDYELEIKAIDDQSGENKEVITFTRTEDEIEFITPAIVKDVQPKQFISLWLINGNPTNIKIEACNNGLDDKPSWEDVTAEATEATPYSFKNSTKTADKWAVMAKISLDGKGGSK